MIFEKEEALRMKRTLEALVASVDSLKQSISWRLPLALGSTVAIGIAVGSLLVKFS